MSRLTSFFILAICLGAAHANDEIARRVQGNWLITTPENIPALRKGAILEFIYLSTDDCRYCAQWESRSKGELLASPEGKAVRFVEVKGDTLRLPIQQKHFPEEHKWVFEQIGPSRGVPRFLLAIDGKIMLNAFGTGGYSEVFLPALRQVIARRDAGS